MLPGDDTRPWREVLKFMGDGLLAIFAIADDETEACKRALAAARQAQANIAALASSAMPGLRFGLALHIGDVLYGNIGSGNRLDFTCIGPAVNCVARIEKLTGQLVPRHPRLRRIRALLPGRVHRSRRIQPCRLQCSPIDSTLENRRQEEFNNRNG
jgi:class 3 adenylate cyclase